jgi:MFS family permease
MNDYRNINGANGLKRIFRTLASRNYRLFFTGQSISLIGTWMQRVAISWLVYHLTSSELLLGLVSFLGLIPVFVLSPFAGVLADRIQCLRLLIVTQILAMVQALILAVMVMTGHISIEAIMLLSLFLGLVNAFDTPVRQAFTVEMIEKKEDIGNAIALNSAMFNGARLLGPSIAGLLIAALGEGPCFLFNGLSYLAVIASLLRMRINPVEKKTDNQKLLHGLKEGFLYSFGFPPIRTVLALLVVVSVMGMPYMVLMPVFAKDILHGGPHTYGFLLAAAGCGALMGAIFLALRTTVAGLENVIPRTAALFGFAIIAFAFSHDQWLSMFILVFAGFGLMVEMAASNTVLQSIVDEDKRGRVMSFYVMCAMGTAPIGSLLAGFVADQIGAPKTLWIGGVCCIFSALLFKRKLPQLKDMIRPIYIQKGILPEVASGLQSDAQLPKPPVG